MSYTPTEQDYRLLKQKYKNVKLKLDFIDRYTAISYGQIQGYVIDYNLSVDSQSNYRRIFNAELIVNNQNMALLKKNTLLLNWLMQPYIGYQDVKSNEVKWYLLGTFAFTEKSYTYSADTNTLNIDCVDQMAYLDGTLGGNISGVNEVQIYAYRDNLYYSVVKKLYEDNVSVPYAAYFSSNTKITLPLPNNIYDTAYERNLTIHSCGHNNTCNIGLSGGRVDVFLADYDAISSDVFTVTDVDVNKSQNISLGVGGVCSYLLDDTTGNTLMLTALLAVHISKIEIYDYFVSEENPIVIWNFGYEFTINDRFSSVYPTSQNCRIPNILTDFSDEINCALTDITLTDERFTNYGNEVSINGKRERCAIRYYGYDAANHMQAYYITQPMIATIDTTEGEQVTVKEVVAAFLDRAGITKYNIDDINEVIPYDQELSADITYSEVFRQLISLYEDIEMFFDIDGCFIMKHIPTTEDVEPVLTNDTLRGIVVDEKYNEDLTSFYNVTEIWGSQINADYYATNNTEDVLVSYDKKENVLTAYYDKLPVTDDNSIISGTVLALQTPDNILNHSANIEACINNTNGAPINLKTKGLKINVMWQIGIELENKLQNFDVSDTNMLPYKDVVFYGQRLSETSSKYMIYYDIRHIQGDKVKQYFVDGIDFRYRLNNETDLDLLVIYLKRPNYIYDYTTNTKYLDIDNLEACIKFRAKQGEVVRFYFMNQSTLSIADSNGNILLSQSSSTNIDNIISYMDFYSRAASEEEYYVFDGITNLSGIGSPINNTCAAILGMGKFSYSSPSIPIKDMYSGEALTAGFLVPNTSYCFQYAKDVLWYLGQWQIHAVAVEMKKIPSDLDKYYEKYNTKNLIITQYDPANAVDVIGEKNQVLTGEDYDNIYSDGLALERADWENWKSMHIGKSLTLTALSIPWLECNKKITYQPNSDEITTYMTDKINYNSNGTMSLEITPFYPRYKNINGLTVYNAVSTVGMVNDLPRDNTMFSSSLYNYNLFDYKYYANKYSDLKNKYGYNALQLWKHWCSYGILEGRQCSAVYNFLIYINYTSFISEQNIYINTIKSAFGNTYTNDNGYKNMAMYLHFLDKGINDYNVVCSSEFNIKVYSEHEDLKAKYGNEWRKYYEHYVKYNYIENKVCI